MENVIEIDNDIMMEGASSPAKVTFKRVQKIIESYDNFTSTKQAMSHYLDVNTLARLEEQYRDYNSICRTSEFNALKAKYNIL